MRNELSFLQQEKLEQAKFSLLLCGQKIIGNQQLITKNHVFVIGKQQNFGSEVLSVAI